MGSSKYISLDPPINAIATESLLFYPPERFLDSTLVLSTKSTSFMAYKISSWNLEDSTPLKVAKSLRCSITLRSANKTSCYGQNPIKDLIFSISVSTSYPKASAHPVVIS